MNNLDNCYCYLQNAMQISRTKKLYNIKVDLANKPELCIIKWIIIRIRTRSDILMSKVQLFDIENAIKFAMHSHLKHNSLNNIIVT